MRQEKSRWIVGYFTCRIGKSVSDIRIDGDLTRRGAGRQNIRARIFDHNAIGETLARQTINNFGYSSGVFPIEAHKLMVALQIKQILVVERDIVSTHAQTIPLNLRRDHNKSKGDECDQPQYRGGKDAGLSWN